MKIWMLPSYKKQTPSSNMRVHRIAEALDTETVVIPYNWTVQQKHDALKDVKPYDYVLVQKWRNEFNQAEHISQLNGIKIFDMDDITEDQEAIDLAQECDILFLANHYLLKWGQERFPDKRHVLVPTGIDIPDKLHPFRPDKRPDVVIAKYGVDRYILPISRIGIWEELYKEYNIAMRILGTTRDNSKKLAQERIGRFCKTYPLIPFNQFWSKYGKTVSRGTFGIMPLGKNAQGKSAFSVLTMMAAGLPVIASPYGECDYIIDNGKNGFLANTSDEWLKYSHQILSDTKLRQRLSIEGIRTIVKSYTIHRIAERIKGALALP